MLLCRKHRDDQLRLVSVSWRGKTNPTKTLVFVSVLWWIKLGWFIQPVKLPGPNESYKISPFLGGNSFGVHTRLMAVEPTGPVLFEKLILPTELLCIQLLCSLCYFFLMHHSCIFYDLLLLLIMMLPFGMKFDHKIISRLRFCFFFFFNMLG